MIVTPKFVFLNLHHSGGDFVEAFLRRFVPGARHIGHHLPRKMTPPEYAHLPVIGYVRSPWSYYLHWYQFQMRRPYPNHLFRVLSDDGALDFIETTKNMMNLGAGSVRLELLLRALPKQYGNQGLNLPAQELEFIRDSRLGFYSFLYRYLYLGGVAPVTIATQEDLRNNLVPLLQQVGEPITEEMRAHLKEEAPRDKIDDSELARRYSRELYALVAERDAEVIAGHGYRFGS